MIKCVIIDDEQPAINVIQKYISKMPFLQLAGTSTNPLRGIELVREHKADVVFLDIQMDEMSGIDVMKVIGKETKIVFCTAYSEFAAESYDMDAVDYLMKPITFGRFQRAVQRVSDKLHHTSSSFKEVPGDYFFIKAELKGKMIKIDIDDIELVEGKRNYVAFYRGQKKTLAYQTLRELEGWLPESRFIRVHKSYIIAIPQIASIENGDIVLKNNPLRIPIGQNYKEQFMERVKHKLIP